MRAHRDGMRVVGWYLPTFADVDADLERMTSIARFNVLGHRFDGLAVDIEDVDTVADVDVRNQRLVELLEAASSRGRQRGRWARSCCRPC